jgi:branched-chain amino acid transport system ATP-binding protein
VVTLLGRNGAGKTTTMRAIMGMLGRRTGSVRFEGAETIQMPSNLIARAGIAYCPEERGIFASLNVRENLELPPVVKPGGLSIEEIYELFPRLLERTHSQGTKLSGGEQQMLAIGRALMTNPHLLILDEATEGISPLIRREIWSVLARLKAAGQTILVIDKYLQEIQRVADHHVFIEKGHVPWTGDNARLAAQPDLWERYLGV